MEQITLHSITLSSLITGMMPTAAATDVTFVSDDDINFVSSQPQNGT